MAHITELDADTLEEITRYRDMGYELLEYTTPPDKADDVVARIDRCIKQIRAKEIDMPEQEQIIALGVLLGEQYISAFNWDWKEVMDKNGEASVRVFSPDHSQFNNPIRWVDDLLNGEEAVNILTVFYSAMMGKQVAAKSDQEAKFL